MTQSPNQNNQQTSRHIIVKSIYPGESKSAKYKRNILNNIFTRFLITDHFNHTSTFLTRLNKLLEFGVSIKAPKQWSNFSDFDLNETWAEWLLITTEAKDNYKVNINVNSTDDKRTKTTSKLVNCILSQIEDPLESNSTSLQLMLIAIQMLPDKIHETIITDSLIKDLEQASRFKSLLIKLPLGMTSTPPSSALRSTYKTCQKYVKTKKLDKSYTSFFNHIDEMCRILLTGNYIHIKYSLGTSPHKDNSSAKNKSHRFTKLYEKHKVENKYTPPYFISDNPSHVAKHGLYDTQENNAEVSHKNTRQVDTGSEHKSKYWIQQYTEAVPWNNNGLTPFTQKILTQWIKRNTATQEALIIGLMLSTGKKIEDLMEFTTGSNNNITTDGFYRPHYLAPPDSFKPNDKESYLYIKTTNTIQIKLPKLIRNMLSLSINENDKTLTEAMNISTEELNYRISKVIKLLIEKGAKNLARDTIHINLRKMISHVTNGDDAIGYMITGKDKDAAPTTNYYCRISEHSLQKIYDKAVGELLK